MSDSTSPVRASAQEQRLDLEFCPRCGSGPHQKADVVECPDCGRKWEGPRLADFTGDADVNGK